LSSCPCGFDRALDGCCGAYLAGKAVPDTGILMRSRYAAYVLGKMITCWLCGIR